MISNSSSNDNICLKQVMVTTENDVDFKFALDVKALYDTGASHNFISKDLLSRLNIDVSVLKTKTLNIKIGNNETSKEIICYELLLLLKLRKIFDEKNFDSNSLVSVKDLFYVYDCGQNMIISYPLLTEIHNCTDLDDLLQLERISMESPEEQKEEIFDLAYLGSMFEDIPNLEFNIDKNFPAADELIQMLKQFTDMFTSAFASKHLQVSPFEIKLREDANLLKAYPRRVAPHIQEKVDKEVQKLLDLGIIRPSSSHVCFPIVVAKKPDGSIRLCVDYSELNKWTIPLRFPMPNIESILDRLAGKSYFATLDMMMGYHQWLVDEKSIPLTAFVTQTGLYEYTRVPFGCMNAPNGFQQIMRQILAPHDGIICEVYLDDIIITGDNPSNLILNVQKLY